jgi:hypothetical protein
VSDTFYYAIQSQGANEWEVGTGTYLSANTFARTTVLSSSNAGSAVNFSAGTKDVFLTLAAARTVQLDNDGDVIISANSASDALRITQVGAGNALLVEDSANPDATPFVVTANGTVVSGYTSAISGSGSLTPRIQLAATDAGGSFFGTSRWTASANAGGFDFLKSRGAAVATNGIVSSGDTLGQVRFAGDDGSGFVLAASISSAVDGTPSASDMPGRLVFSTTNDGGTSPAERMRITSAGNVGIGTTAPAVKLAISSTDAVLVPVGTTGERPTGATGYLRFNSTTTNFEGYNGTGWGSIGTGAATGGGTDQVFFQNGQTVTTSYSIPSGQNAGTFGPITVASGVTVTVPSGSVWTVV